MFETPFRITNRTTIDYYDSLSYEFMAFSKLHTSFYAWVKTHTLQLAWDCREKCLCLLTQFPLSAAVSDFSCARPLDEL